MEIPVEVMRIAEEIKTMKLRGAGKIARAAAKALMISALEYNGPNDVNSFITYMNRIKKILLNTRPTAVSLPNAVLYVTRDLGRIPGSFEDAKRTVVERAREFIKYSLEAKKKIGVIGAKRILDGETILTHCNSSVAIEILKTAFLEGKKIRVYATETRPLFQGHLTAKQLLEIGIPVTLIPDAAVRLVMKNVDKVIVGADTVAANGAVVNKIGTSQIALSAHEARVRVFVAAETFKFSPATVIGELVVIEERSPIEVVGEDFLKNYPSIDVRNPSFDVTPPEYIDAIITERGLIPPQASILILREVFGWTIEDYIVEKLSEV